MSLGGSGAVRVGACISDLERSRGVTAHGYEHVCND